MLALVILILLSACGEVRVFAATDTTRGELGEDFFNDVLDGKVEENAQTLMEMLNARSLFEQFWETAGGALGEISEIFCSVMGLILISAVANRTSEGMAREGVIAGVRFIGSASLGAALILALSDDFDMIKASFEALGTLIGSMIPISAAVLAMGGNVSTASVSSGTLYVLMAIIEKVCAATVIPVCCVMGMTALCSALSNGSLLSGFAGAVKKIYNFGISALMVILVFVLGAQTSIASAADTAAARGGKLLTQTLIPGIGGAVGDTLRTVAGSVQYIKSVVGVGGVLTVAAVTLPPIISLLMTRLVFLLTSGAADMLGCKQESRLLCELGNIYACLLGALSVCSVTFCVALGIFVKCTVAVG